MNFTKWVQSHHRSILFLMTAFGVAGLFSSLSLPVSLFPQVDFPRVVVSLDAGNRPAERMAIEVTTPVEQAIRAVPGVRSVRSTTSRGSAEVSINFDWGADMVAAKLQTESAINQVVGSLPGGTTFEVRRMDPTVFPVLGYSLVSDTHSLVELRDLALYQMRPVLSTVTGVSRIDVQGGATAEYQVMVNPAKLDALGMSLDDVAGAEASPAGTRSSCPCGSTTLTLVSSRDEIRVREAERAIRADAVCLVRSGVRPRRWPGPPASVLPSGLPAAVLHGEATGGVTRTRRRRSHHLAGAARGVPEPSVLPAGGPRGHLPRPRAFGGAGRHR